MSEQGEREKLTDEQWARFLEHRGLVEMVATEMAPRLGGRFTFEDALALGEDGLIKAVLSHDALRDDTFRRYAITRIRGAMWDALRKVSNDDERVRGLCNAAAMDYLGRRRREGDAFTDLDGRAEERLLDHAGGLVACIFATVAGAAPPRDPEEELAAREESARGKAALGRAMKKLGPQEEKVIALRYEQGMELAEVQRVLHVRHPAAYRLHDRTVVKLHKLLEEEGVTELPPRDDEIGGGG